MTTMRNPEHQSFNPEEFSLKEILRPKRTALIVVDMQNDFLSNKGFFATSHTVPGNVDQMQSIVPNVISMVEAARQNRVPVIFTKGYEDVQFRSGPDLRRAVKWQEKDGNGSVNSESGTWGSELYEGIQPEEGDIVVEKHKWSSFSGQDKEGRTLEQILQQFGVETVVVTGVVAETCVESTIRDAYGKGFFVVVPKNSVGSNDPKQLENRLAYWEAGFVGDVVDEQEIKDIWESYTSKNTSTEHPQVV